MKFYKELYVSESLTKKKDRILKRLKEKRYPVNIYLIVLIEEGPNQLEYYSTALLKQSLLCDRAQFVVGIAAGYDDALYLVEEIVENVYKETGGADIRSYIKKKDSWEN